MIYKEGYSFFITFDLLQKEYLQLHNPKPGFFRLLA